jgi:hypothetical protein
MFSIAFHIGGKTTVCVLQTETDAQIMFAWLAFSVRPDHCYLNDMSAAPARCVAWFVRN